jgi:ATP-dependent RNA helicase DHX8/PRP22
LPGIRYVVDSGKHKCRHVLPTGMDSLSIQPVSQAQAAQRSGRAGRIQAGVCFRLYTEESFHKLAANSVPEILRVNLAQVVLQLKGMGITDPASFDFVTPPDQASLVRATKLLYALAALDDKMELTDYGKKLAKLPLDPVFGHLLLQSAEYGCVSEMLSAVAVLSAENLFYRPTGEGGPAAKAGAAHRRFASHEGDLPTFLNVYSAWQKEAVYVPPSSGGLKAQKKRLKLEKQQVGQKGQGHAKLLHGEWCQRNYISGRALARAYHVRQQLQALCARPADRNGLGMDVNLSAGKDREVFLKCAAAGLFLQAASRVKTEREVESNNRGRSGTAISTRGRYRTKLGNENVSIHPTSTLFGRHPSPSCVVFTEMVTTTRTYIRGVTQIREEWLHEVAPNFYS